MIKTTSDPGRSAKMSVNSFLYASKMLAYPGINNQSNPSFKKTRKSPRFLLGLFLEMEN